MRSCMTLRARLPSHFRSAKEDCFAELIFLEGVMASCAIKTVNRGSVLFLQEEAFRRLEELGTLQWQCIERQELPLARQTLPFARETRQASSASTQFKMLPHRHKQVLLLVNNGKDRAQIARLLSLSEERVAHILHELHPL
jgi:DNA-binding NarL/FixJ family response regulator